MSQQSWRGVTWEVGYEHFVAYIHEHGPGPIPSSVVCDDGFQLGSWVSTQRTFRRNGRIKPDRLELLDQHGFDWEPAAAARSANLALLAEYLKEYGDINVPVMYRSRTGKPIGKWLQAQIGAYHEGKLSDHVRVGLEVLGVDWTFGRVDPFDMALDELRRYVETEGDVHVPNSYVAPSGFALGKWFAKNKSLMKKAALPPERIQQLRELGVDPDRDMREEAWLQGFDVLRKYHAEVGDARVPSHHVTRTGFALGSWRRTQRSWLKSGRLRADRKTLLDQLDPTWNDTRPTGWAEEHALESLREAATMAYPLTSSAYESLRFEGAVRGPAPDWFGHHFASWAAACEAAGVDGGTDYSGSVVYADADLEASALLFFTECGIGSSSRAYTEWLEHHEGHPSAAAIIRRFGSWPAVRRNLADRLAQGE
ncbi:helicase associated domain-containing protein [Nocardioides sp. SYSU DS0651]|uniref:helicase associated domain-containing protein n=1 Tax=Nocardioides sp. SYSU DS0651 TaxID=3415955 RepID=UPI003F4C8710